MKRVYIETYGCQMNVADSELMFGVLGREGYVRADDPAEADVMLVNTCAVRDNAEQRVIGRHGRAAAATSAPGTCSASSAAWRSVWVPSLLEQVAPRWTWSSGPTPIAICPS